ncbi:MAG: HAMP domain-containing protein [Planctomycetes bacterium]|nr:HAMP domain-containing protein [Planctomycetota bacterium]
MRSIRTRITLAVVGCTALTVAIAATVVALAGRKMLFDALDERLLSRARWFSVVPRFPEPPRESAEVIAAREAAARETAANGGASGASPAAGEASGERGTERGAATPPSGGGERDGRGEREGRSDRDGRDGRDSRGPGPIPFTRSDSPSTPQFWALVCDADDHAEISRYGDLPDGLSLATLGVKPGDPPSDVRLEDGRRLRVVALANHWVWRGRGRGNDGPPSAPGAAPGATSGAAPGEPPRDERHAATTWLALEATDVHGEARRLVGMLAAAWGAATLLAWLASWGVARAVLKPVAGMSQTIAALSPENLAARVPMEEVPAELSAVGTRLNALLQRVQSAFERERATIANMAHELRTPISALRTELEFAQFRADARPADKRTIESSLALALRMQALVNALLTMSRIESGQEVLARSEVDVARTLRDAWSTVAARAQERGLTWRYRGPESLPFFASADHLHMVAANLLDNAVSHGAVASGGGGEVEVTLERHSDGANGAAGGITFTIANRCESGASSPGNLFEPFWRSDPARSDARHFGLGLALCDRVVRLLGGTIAAAQEDRLFRVRVTLPATA